jgi:chaperone BCS1
MHLLASAIHNGIEPEKLFERYIPGFETQRNFFLRYFRINLTKVLSFGFFSLLYMTAGRSVLSQAYEQFLGYLTSTVSIPANDQVNREVLTWMSHHINKQNTPHISVQSADSASRNRWGAVSVSDRSTKHDSKTVPTVFYPAMGKQYFIFESRPFIFDLRLSRYVYDQLNAIPNGEEPILIRCLGRNPAPLKRFLNECKRFSLESKQSMTTIYTTHVEKYGTRLTWREAGVRPIRPMSTVDIEADIKQDILKQVKDHLHPSMRLYLARRGIPYRKGFLLYGPPGTGKTSFSIALAGHFELDLYILSLASNKLDDDSLMELFSALPTHCIVLLEDIDSAGIDREAQDSEDEDANANLGKTKSKSKSKSTDKDNDNGKDKNQGKSHRRKRNSQPVTLSGLLNTIDGAASQEGRILIMTSNTPETLDEALIRHGRIDKMIKFDYISRHDAKQLFIRMFTLHEDEMVDSSLPISSKKEGPQEEIAMSHEDDVKRFAEEFSSKIPERQLSPAEIQGFLLEHREDIKGVLAKVSGWIADTLAARSKKDDSLYKLGITTANALRGLTVVSPTRPKSR